MPYKQKGQKYARAVQRKKEARKHGMCSQCSTRQPRKGRKTCQRCADNSSNYFARLRKKGLCFTCQFRQAIKGKTKCTTCRKKNLARLARLRGSGRCTHSGCSRKPKGLSLCRKHSVNALIQSRARKQAVVDAYGGRCDCCGETGLDFLTIDHVSGNGAAHRRKLFGNSRICGARFYRWLAAFNFPRGFRVLCWNCNFSVHLNKGKCLHTQPGGVVQ